MHDRLAPDQVRAIADILSAHPAVFLSTDELNSAYEMYSQGSRLPPLCVATIAPAWNTLRLCAGNLITSVAKLAQAAHLYKHPADVPLLCSVLLAPGQYPVTAVLDCFAFVTGKKLASELKKSPQESVADLLVRAAVPDWTVADDYVLVGPALPTPPLFPTTAMVPALLPLPLPMPAAAAAAAAAGGSSSTSPSPPPSASSLGSDSSRSIWGSCLFMPESLQYPAAPSAVRSSVSPPPTSATAPITITTTTAAAPGAAIDALSSAVYPQKYASAFAATPASLSPPAGDDDFSKTAHKRLYNRRASSALLGSLGLRDRYGMAQATVAPAGPAHLGHMPSLSSLQHHHQQQQPEQPYLAMSGNNGYVQHHHQYTPLYHHQVGQQCAIDSMSYANAVAAHHGSYFSRFGAIKQDSA
ncbi:hypothetical protein RI367_000806 [Sorochytrium milnesiophthora]